MESSVVSSISAKVHIVLTEVEARALLGIAEYGADAFLRVFYEHLGRSYLKDHELGLKSLFKSIKPIEFELKKIDKARVEFEKPNK